MELHREGGAELEMVTISCIVTSRGCLVIPGATKGWGCQHIRLWTEPQCPPYAKPKPQAHRGLSPHASKSWLRFDPRFDFRICPVLETRKAKTLMPTALSAHHGALGRRRGHLEPDRVFQGGQDSKIFCSSLGSGH